MKNIKKWFIALLLLGCLILLCFGLNFLLTAGKIWCPTCKTVQPYDIIRGEGGLGGIPIKPCYECNNKTKERK